MYLQQEPITLFWGSLALFPFMLSVVCMLHGYATSLLASYILKFHGCTIASWVQLLGLSINIHLILTRTTQHSSDVPFVLTLPSAFGFTRSSMDQLPIMKTLCRVHNPGSLMDRLPSKGSAQQTTLRMTRNSWADPNT